MTIDSLWERVSQQHQQLAACQRAREAHAARVAALEAAIVRAIERLGLLLDRAEAADPEIGAAVRAAHDELLAALAEREEPAP